MSPPLTFTQFDLSKAPSVSIITIPPGPDGTSYIEHPVISSRFYLFTRLPDKVKRVVDRNKAIELKQTYAEAIKAAFEAPLDEEALAHYNMIANQNDMPDIPEGEPHA